MVVLVYNLQIIHFISVLAAIFSGMLDKKNCAVIKYMGIKYRIDRKEYHCKNLQRVWVFGCEPEWRRIGKVHPGANRVKSDK